MSFTSINKQPPAARHARSRWLRGAIVLCLAFTVSACAYDSPYYRTSGGHSSHYYGGHDRNYHRGSYYPKRPDWRAQARHRQIQRRHHAELRRHRAQSRAHQAERRRFHETRKHRAAQRGHIRAHEQRRGSRDARSHREHRRHQ
ncbi:hypothetical protein LKR43_05665 [Pusillimonas sp. MFBS29]|uniref:hypothetical protein n=1 Tax=Pusillimonas sp. MFBS29 TaxID=2886690 RepID=UPI001D1161A2|nr:hypothetical protein [Pusillimonas sp. MFBS29]MCC2595823.1 hypothetical protein [Pusillimonas sp. MFBS29]